MAGSKQSMSMAPGSSGAESSAEEDSTAEGSQVPDLPKTERQDEEGHESGPVLVAENEGGFAAEASQAASQGAGSALSKEVKSVCQRSVRINPLGDLRAVPSDFNAMLARKSMPGNKQRHTFDTRKKEMVNEVIYKQGGCVLDRKTGEWKRVEPGTPLPAPLKKPAAAGSKPSTPTTGTPTSAKPAALNATEKLVAVVQNSDDVTKSATVSPAKASSRSQKQESPGQPTPKDGKTAQTTIPNTASAPSSQTAATNKTQATAKTKTKTKT